MSDYAPQVVDLNEPLLPQIRPGMIPRSGPKLMGIPVEVDPSLPGGVIALISGPSPSEICVAIHEPAKTIDKPAK